MADTNLQRWATPTTRGEAIKLIEQIFTANNWNENEQKQFIADFGLDGEWRDFDNTKLKLILIAFENYKMI